MFSQTFKIASRHLPSISQTSPLIYACECRVPNLLKFRLQEILSSFPEFNQAIIQPANHQSFLAKITAKACEQIKFHFFQRDIHFFKEKISRMELDLLYIRGLPFQNLEDVPLGELFSLAMTEMIGMKPFTYANEHNGRLLHHISPKKEEAFKETGLSSRKSLFLHVENAFDEDRPCFLSLLCVKGDPRAKTTFLSLDEWANISQAPARTKDFHRLAYRKFFKINPPLSHSKGEVSISQLFRRFPNGKLATRFCMCKEMIRSVDEEGGEFLEELRQSIQNHEGLCIDRAVALESGDMILFNNHTLMHGRTAYHPDFTNPERRLLIRSYLTFKKEKPVLRN